MSAVDMAPCPAALTLLISSKMALLAAGVLQPPNISQGKTTMCRHFLAISCTSRRDGFAWQVFDIMQRGCLYIQDVPELRPNAGTKNKRR